MLRQFGVAGMLLLATTVVHMACTGLCLRLVKRTETRQWVAHSMFAELALINAVVLLLVVAAVVESGIWASVYVYIGALETFEEAFYFSTVTFSTLGFGDVTLDSRWRVLSALQAANGTMLLGWSTALVFAFVQAVIQARSQARKA